MEIGQSINSLEELGIGKTKGKKVTKKVSYISEMATGKWFLLPIKLVSTANERIHWSKKSERTKAQRTEAWLTTLNCFACFRITKPPLKIVLTRIGVKALDSDNLAHCFKAVQDGIADALGIDDGDSRIQWIYKQEIGKAYGCKVEIEAK